MSLRDELRRLRAIVMAAGGAAVVEFLRDWPRPGVVTVRDRYGGELTIPESLTVPRMNTPLATPDTTSTEPDEGMDEDEEHPT